MIATHNQHTPDDVMLTFPIQEPDSTNIQLFNPLSSAALLSHRSISHHPKAGVNPLVDAAAYLFSVLGKLKYLKSHRQLNKLQKELIQEIQTLQETIKSLGYNAEYVLVCRYILCATIDDILTHTSWGSQWDTYRLLTVFNQETQQDKFFIILDRAIKEQSLYIDLMELMYMCLSLGYKGQYRATEHSQYQLEQITNTLYKHIQTYRGHVNKTLSPLPLKTSHHAHKSVRKTGPSTLFISFITFYIIIATFAGLGYLTDVISNEAYKNIAPIKNSVSHETSQR